MSWYRGTYVSATEFCPDHHGAWLLEQPERCIQFSNGAFAHVVEAGWNKVVVDAPVVTPHYVWFTVPYLHMTPPYPPLPRGVRQLTFEPTKHYDERSDSGSEIEMGSKRPYRPSAARTEPDGPDHAHNGGRSCGAKLRSAAALLVPLVTFGIIMAHFVVNIEICGAIGRRRTWLWVLMWTLFGQASLMLVGFLGIHVIASLHTERRTRSSYSGLAFASMCVGGVFVIAMGIPFAYWNSREAVAEQYLKPSNWKDINCWRNPDEVFSPQENHYIFLQEPNWMVDWENGLTNKVATIIGKNDNNKDNGKRYNYCLSPLRYTGAVPCQHRIWTVCYRQTTASNALASCTAADAKVCGFEFQANGVVLMLINRKEEFYSDVEGEEETKMIEAIRMADQPANANLPPNMLVYYAVEGPDEMQRKKDEANEKVRDMRIAFYVVYSCCWFIAMVAFKACSS